MRFIKNSVDLKSRSFYVATHGKRLLYPSKTIDKAQFQLVYMYSPVIKQQKTFKDQIIKTM